MLRPELRIAGSTAYRSISMFGKGGTLHGCGLRTSGTDAAFGQFRGIAGQKLLRTLGIRQHGALAGDGSLPNCKEPVVMMFFGTEKWGRNMFALEPAHSK